MSYFHKKICYDKDNNYNYFLHIKTFKKVSNNFFGVAK